MFKLQHGTIVDTRDGHPVRATDRSGKLLWQVRRRAGQTVELEVWRPDRSTFFVRPRSIDHPLFGKSDAIVEGETGAHLAVAAATEWTDPAFIPPVDRPAALPRGTGTALLNVLAVAAKLRGRAVLNYRGPYPTAALFASLTGSFAPKGSDAEERFCSDVENRALVGRMDAVDVDFAPAPHEWTWAGNQVCLQQRNGLERAYVDRRAYDRNPRSGCCHLVPDGDGLVASVVLAGARWHDVLRFDHEGRPIGTPAELPTVTSALDGRSLPEGLGPLLGSLLAERAPVMLAPAIERLLESTPLIWASTGFQLARIEPAQRRIELHSTLGERLLELPPAQMLDHLVVALEPVARAAAQRLLAAKDAATPAS